jgi:hypothetical protein
MQFAIKAWLLAICPDSAQDFGKYLDSTMHGSHGKDLLKVHVPMVDALGPCCGKEDLANSMLSMKSTRKSARILISAACMLSENLGSSLPRWVGFQQLFIAENDMTTIPPF